MHQCFTTAPKHITLSCCHNGNSRISASHGRILEQTHSLLKLHPLLLKCHHSDQHKIGTYCKVIGMVSDHKSVPSLFFRNIDSFIQSRWDSLSDCILFG